MDETELGPARVCLRQGGSDLVDQPGPIDVGKGVEVDGGDGKSTLSTGAPESGSGRRSEMAPVPESPSLSVRFLTPQGAAVTTRPLGSSFDRACEPSQAPRADGTQYDELTLGQLDDQCSQRGYREKES